MIGVTGLSSVTDTESLRVWDWECQVTRRELPSRTIHMNIGIGPDSRSQISEVRTPGGD